MSEAAPSVLPLTLAQRGLWVGHKIAAADATLNIAEALEIRGELDVPLFMQAMRRLAEDLEVARISIAEIDGTPWQSIRPQYQGDVPLIDVSTAENPLQEARRRMLQCCASPADLAVDPLWRNALFRLGRAHYAWYQQAHHVVYDGFSGGLAVRRLSEIYTALISGREIPAGRFEPFARLVEADRSYRDSPRFERDRDFWMQQLAGLPEAVSLSRHGRHRSMGGLRRGSSRLAPETVRRLAELGRHCSASLPQVLITLVAAYYQRMTGVRDLVIGMPVTGRVNPVMRAIPGMVANAVAIRLRFGDDEDMHSLLGQVSCVVRQALRHQQYRYEDVRRDLGLLGQDRHMAWLGVNIEPFDYQLDFGGAEAIPVNLSNGSVEDLTVFFYERGDGRELCFDFDANPALYSQLELDRHAARLRYLATRVLDRPRLQLSRLDVLTPEERGSILGPWRGQPRPFEALNLPATVGDWARRDPDAVAIRHRKGDISYAELETMVRTAALLLAAEGVMPGARIAVAMPRDPLLVAALLAIMQLGAAYVPLDLDAPPQRNALIIEDAQPALLLFDANQGDPGLEQGVRRFDLSAAMRDFGDAALLVSSARRDLGSQGATAYVLYTSGSTGRPKGVEITHANLTSFLQSIQLELKLQRDDRFLAQTTLIFDIAGLELYLPLLAGASMVLAEGPDVRNPRHLLDMIGARQVTHVQATPSLWRMLLGARQVALEHVHVLVGGEALGCELAAELWRRARSLTQLYGPTEATIWSTIQVIDQRPVEVPAIGRPLANTTVHVLDEGMQPVAVGVAGELYIGGDGVARGYIGRPELNASRFVLDPSSTTGGRLYRSGDRVRWRDDGALEFIGRCDNQVKIRGHRIEPGEIEHCLEMHPSVAAAAVVTRDNARGEPTLAGYVSLREGHRFDAGEMARHLSQYLPAYMLPASLQSLPAMPLTPNGKLDRSALPTPERRAGVEHAEPEGPVERQLAALWQDVLGQGPLGRHDNFFELGGDSLTAAQMMSRLSEQWGVELPLGSLFEAATIAGLALRLQEGAKGQDDPLAPVLCLRAGGRQTPLFCVHPVVGVGWGYAALLRHLDASIPVYSLQAHGLRDIGCLPASLEAMAASYITEVRRIQPAGPYRLLGWSLGGMVAQTMAAQLQAQGQAVEFLGLMDAYPFAASAGDGAEAALDMDEAAEAAAALQFLGLAAEPGTPIPQTLDAVAERLCHVYGLEQLELVKSLQRDDPDLLRRVMQVTRHHLALARRHRPPVAAGSAVYFQAKHAEGCLLKQLLQYRPSAWEPYLSGGIELHALACSHQDMLEPAPAAEIGRVLALALKQGPSEAGLPASIARRDAVYA
ncbi:amino acid adenylation domain-containing protein [Frateuria aurantia]